MTAESLSHEALAKALYDANCNRPSCPAWEQLGDVTRSVWIERAASEPTATRDE